MTQLRRQLAEWLARPQLDAADERVDHAESVLRRASEMNRGPDRIHTTLGALLAHPGVVAAVDEPRLQYWREVHRTRGQVET